MSLTKHNKMLSDIKRKNEEELRRVQISSEDQIEQMKGENSDLKLMVETLENSGKHEGGFKADVSNYIAKLRKKLEENNSNSDLEKLKRENQNLRNDIKEKNLVIIKLKQIAEDCYKNLDREFRATKNELIKSENYLKNCKDILSLRQAEISKLSEEVEFLKLEKSDLSEENKSIKISYSVKEEQLASLKVQLLKLSNQLEDTKKQVNERDRRISDHLSGEIDSKEMLAAEYKGLYEESTKYLEQRDAYIQTRENTIESLKEKLAAVYRQYNIQTPLSIVDERLDREILYQWYTEMLWALKDFKEFRSRVPVIEKTQEDFRKTAKRIVEFVRELGVGWCDIRKKKLVYRRRSLT